MSIERPALYIVATPIGNLDDLSVRAAAVLHGADHIAAEDTRRTRILLQHIGAGTPMLALHDHNEREVTPGLLRALQNGEAIALVSDAGTPLLSDPGFHLVRAAHEQGTAVIPVPGASALTCALSAAGVPCERFVFEGFLPARAAARRKRLQELVREPRTFVLFESSHRIEAALQDLCEIFGPEREAALARELTKRFETIRRSTLCELAQWIRAKADHRKGEFVLIVRGATAADAAAEAAEARRVLGILLPVLPKSQAVEIAAALTGLRRKTIKGTVPFLSHKPK